MRVPKIGDIWLMEYPYTTPGNMKKVRPGIIRGFGDEDTIIVQKLTTKQHNNKIFNNEDMKRKTYISKELAKIKDYDLIRYIGKER